MLTSDAPEARIDPARLRRFLKERGWTITRLAKEMGVSQSFASQVVNGHEQPGRKFLLGLLAIGIDLRGLIAEPAGPQPSSAADA